MSSNEAVLSSKNGSLVVRLGSRDGNFIESGSLLKTGKVLGSFVKIGMGLGSNDEKI
jgi:hypothetical protein